MRQAIIKEAANHDLVVMGASAQPTNASPDGRYLFGTLAESVASKARPTVIVVKTKQSLGLATFDELRASEGTLAHADAFVERSRSLPVVVDKWFAENTFHAHEFSDIRKLVALKERQNLTISLGLPALNEEKTIGTVIKRVKGALVDRVPLIDQIVVIDSDSEDRTREIAAELGVPVHRHSDILPELGSYIGKGEALWKSLHVLDGDIVAWIDTDISNIQPRFVYGLIGPLLQEPQLQYVKGFYQRPIRSGGKLQAEGGGRVTELMARPLINLFFPELSGMIQPLSGEYAGRRSLLERLPFFTGYAVEIGLLIDILDQAGLQSVGQVDLERRIHRNQPLPNLSQMAYVILQGGDPQARGASSPRAADRGRARHEAHRHRQGPLQPRSPGDRRRDPAADDHDPRLCRASEGAQHESAALRVLVAPDSFGGALDSVAVAAAIARGWSRVRRDDEVVRADGRWRRGNAGRTGRRARRGAERGRWRQPTRSAGRSTPTGCSSTRAASRSSRWPRRPASRS